MKIVDNSTFNEEVLSKDFVVVDFAYEKTFWGR